MCSESTINTDEEGREFRLESEEKLFSPTWNNVVLSENT